MFLLDSIRKRTEIEEKKLQNLKEEMKECSFRPSLTNNPRFGNNSNEKRESLSSTNKIPRYSTEKSQKPFSPLINIRGVPIVEEHECSEFGIPSPQLPQ